MNSLLMHKQSIRQRFSELHLMARKQAELLSQTGADNIEDTITILMGLIEQRQGIMEAIDQAQELFRKQSQEHLQGYDPALKQSIELEEAAIFKSILAIQSCDAECGIHAERLLQLTGSEANKARQNLKALKSYSGTGQYSDSQFFDGYK